MKTVLLRDPDGSLLPFRWDGETAYQMTENGWRKASPELTKLVEKQATNDARYGVRPDRRVR